MPVSNQRFTSLLRVALIASSLGCLTTSAHAQLVPLPADPSPEPAAASDEHPWLGVSMEERDGNVVVVRTIPASPARAAGIARDTRIVSIDGHQVQTTGDVIARVGVRATGDQVSLELELDGVRSTVQLTLTARPNMTDISRLMLGTPVPALSVQNLSDSQVAQLVTPGRVNIVEFWATWCGPCAAVRPDMVALRSAHSETDLAMVAVSAEPIEVLATYAEQHQVPYRIASDTDGEVSAELFVLSLPSWVVIDENNVIVGVFSGSDKFDEMSAQVSALLRR